MKTWVYTADTTWGQPLKDVTSGCVYQLLYHLWWFKSEISSCSWAFEHVVPNLGTFKRHKQHPCWRKSLAAGFESKGLSPLPVFPVCFQLSVSCSCGHVCRLLTATLPQHDGLLHLIEPNAKIMHFLNNLPRSWYFITFITCHLIPRCLKIIKLVNGKMFNVNIAFDRVNKKNSVMFLSSCLNEDVWSYIVNKYTQ